MNKAKASAKFCVDYGDNLEEISKDFEIIELGFHEGLGKILKNPTFNNEKKAGIAKKVFGDTISPFSQKFLEYLVMEDSWNLITKIKFEFDKMVAEGNQVTRVKVVTANELNSDNKQYIKDGLEKKIHTKIILENEVNEEILGGLQIKIEDKIWDNSIKGKIDTMYQAISRES